MIQAAAWLILLLGQPDFAKEMLSKCAGCWMTLAVLSPPGGDVSLNGIDALCVHVSVSDELKLRFDPADVGNAVESRLRSAGLRLVAGQDSCSFPLCAALLVSVEGICLGEHPMCSYSIQFSILEDVFLRRSMLGEQVPHYVLMQTWKGTRRIFLAGDDRVLVVKQSIENASDEFINEYLKSNPKDTTSSK